MSALSGDPHALRGNSTVVAFDPNDNESLSAAMKALGCQRTSLRLGPAPRLNTFVIANPPQPNALIIGKPGRGTSDGDSR